MHEADYLDAKAADFLEFTRWALLVTIVFVAFTVFWDYAIDPVNAYRAVGYRLAEAGAVGVWALASWRDLRAPVARVAALVMLLFIDTTFIHILSMLEDGTSYGVGGFLYFFIFVPFLMLAQPFRFSFFLFGLITVFPMVVAPLGLDAGLDWGVYCAYVLLVFWPVVCILLLFEYLYLNVFSYRRQIETQASTDSLTRIANRRLFLGEGNSCLAWHAGHGREASILFIDIDRFKIINDTHGHVIGDATIKHLVATLLPVLREHDLPARYGGEEFAVLLRETGYEQALRIAERIRATVAKQPFRPDVDGASAIPLTVSIGVATYRPGVAPDIDVLINAADHALYEAKRTGRDCVVGCAA